MAPGTAEPEASFTIPWITLAALPWTPPDWPDARPGVNDIQSVAARQGSSGQTVHRRTPAAARLNQTSSRDVVMCPLRTIHLHRAIGTETIVEECAMT